MKKNLFVLFTVVFPLFAIYATLLVKVPHLRPSTTAVWNDVQQIASYFSSEEEMEYMTVESFEIPSDDEIRPPSESVRVGSDYPKGRWVNRNEDPLIPRQMLPNEVGDADAFEYDRVIRSIANSESRDDLFRQRRLKQGIAFALYRDKNPGREFEREFARVFRRPAVEVEVLRKGYKFDVCPLVGSKGRSNGEFMLMYDEPMVVYFDDPMTMLVYEPMRITSGPNAGRMLSPVVTLDPINVSCIEALPFNTTPRQ